MANIVNKIKIKTAVAPKTQKRPMLFNHVTSTSFFRPSVAHFYEVVPDQDIKVSTQCHLRMDPLFKPFLGSAALKLNAFFVPYRTVNRTWDDYITDTKHVWSDGSNSSIVTGDRTIEMGVIQDTFIGVGGSSSISLATAVNVSTREAVLDFVLDSSHPSYSSSIAGYQFTPEGLQIMKLLNALGYRVSFNSADRNTVRNIQPLLCVARVFGDWYFPSSYSEAVTFNTVKSFIEANTPSTMNLSTGVNIFNAIPQVLLGNIFRLCLLSSYDLDYYTSAFDNPSGPNQSLFSNYALSDQTGINVGNSPNYVSNTVSSFNPNGVPNLGVRLNATGVTNNYGRITQYGLELLNSLSNYLRRHQLSGSRSIDRFLSRFGFTNTPEKFDRSILVGQKSLNIPVGDVMSHSDTTGASLGEYAGQAVINGSLDFEFSNKSVDYGMFIIIYNVVPLTSYCQGERRDVLKLSKLDHWTPEFDGRGVDAIAKSQLLVSQNANYTFGSLNSDPYAYSPRYSSDKCGFDTISGLFSNRFIHNNEAGSPTLTAFNPYKSWHLERLLAENSQYISHTSSTLNAEYDRGQYNRVFYNASDNAPDNMYVIFRTTQVNDDHMLDVFDDYMLQHDDNGQDIMIKNQGVTLN